jgi:hypothetical protein
MIFETKKIRLETLSEYLAEVRAALGLSIAEVSTKTNIKPVFLESLERNEFRKLPADVYVYGFLRQLGTLYSIDSRVLVEQYKKELAIQNQLQKKPLFKSSQTRKLLGKIAITPKYLSIAIGLLFILGTLGYIIWQVSSINKTPSLEIFSPQDRQIIKDSIVSVSGHTDPGMSLAINQQNIFVDNQGNFKTDIGVDNGPKQLLFSAQNKFDKSTTKTITIIGDNAGATGTASTTSPIGSGVRLQFEFTDNVTLTYNIDGGQLQTLVANAGDQKSLVGQNKIVISTSNAGATKLIYNGQNIGIMGKPKEKLINVPFIP